MKQKEETDWLWKIKSSLKKLIDQYQWKQTASNFKILKSAKHYQGSYLPNIIYKGTKFIHDSFLFTMQSFWK